MTKSNPRHMQNTSKLEVIDYILNCLKLRMSVGRIHTTSGNVEFFVELVKNNFHFYSLSTLCKLQFISMHLDIRSYYLKILGAVEMKDIFDYMECNVMYVCSYDV